MKNATFVVSCPEVPMSKVRNLNDMIASERQITLQTFRKKVAKDEFEAFQRNIGYSVGSEPGLHIKDDFAIGFYSSKVEGIPVAFVRWSAMEYVFVEPKNLRAACRSLR